MALNGYMDDQLDMLCDGFFDNIDDLLDFSADDEALGMVESANAVIPLAAPAAAEFPAFDSEECGVIIKSEENKFCNDINIGEDWISNFLCDSNFDDEIKKNDSLFQSLSPVSVLEPSNISSTDNAISSSSSLSSASSDNASMPPVGPTIITVPARARSKRPRRPAIPILAPSEDGPPAIPTLLPEFEPTLRKKKIKKTGLGSLSANADDTTGVRKCLHCGIQKTPQWRAGPMGPKTLCNACGVRYKSGRLFPEYRPAASPTFVPTIHSNSHKKVVEMRNKVIEHEVANEYNPAAKNCDLLKYIRV